MNMEIKVTVKASLSPSYPGITTLNSTLEEAILYFIFGPPEQEETALKIMKEIIDFASRACEILDKSNSDN